METQSELINQHSAYTLPVDENFAGSRLDVFIAHHFPLYSRTFFQKMIDNGTVTLNGSVITKPGLKLRLHDDISIVFQKPDTQSKKNGAAELPVQVLFQHQHFLIVNKPPFLPVHAPSQDSPVISLVDWITSNYQEIAHVGSIDRPGIVHRLDKDTSGLLIIARTNYAHTIFSALFKERAIQKTYVALVAGYPPSTGTIDFPIGRHALNRKKMTVYKPRTAPLIAGALRNATTYYKTIEKYLGYSLLEVKPITGRTHQIRVHCTAIGHPIVGDSLYGPTSPLINRQALHAYKLEFNFEGEQFNFTCPLPDDITTALQNVQIPQMHNQEQYRSLSISRK